MTTATLAPALRTLIDERLDGIDRVLRHARTPRPERLEILESVENQIVEMLGKRAPDEPTRRDLLAVLAELDPPEAYALGDEPRRRDAEPMEFGEPKTVASHAPLAPAKWSTLALVAGLGVPVWIAGAGVTLLIAYTMKNELAALILYGGMATGVFAAFVNVGIGVWAMARIAQSRGALKGMAFAAAGACLPLLLLFHLIASWLCMMLVAADANGVGLLLWIPYVVSLPLPVAWALFERFRHRECTNEKPADAPRR